MTFEAKWGGNTCGEGILPGQSIDLRGEHRGFRRGNEYVHVNPSCDRVAELVAEGTYAVPVYRDGTPVPPENLR